MNSQEKVNAMRGYDPYPYQPMMRYFYEGAGHVNAVNDFSRWLQNAAPNAYNDVMRKNSALLNPSKAVYSGALGTMCKNGGRGGSLSGMGNGELISEPPGADSGNPVTQWGNSLLDIAKGWMTYDTQRQLLQVNIARAEKGLPPITGDMVAPQVNFGVSSQLQTMGGIALAAVVGIGLLSVLRRK